MQAHVPFWPQLGALAAPKPEVLTDEAIELADSRWIAAMGGLHATDRDERPKVALWMRLVAAASAIKSFFCFLVVLLC